MCTEIKMQGKIISQQCELAYEIGSKNMVMCPGYEYYGQYCLCGVDVWKIAQNLGLRIVQTGMYYHLGDDECEKAIAEEKRIGERLGEKYIFYKDSKEVGYER